MRTCCSRARSSALFVTFDRGANWQQLKNGLPTVPVFDMQIHPRDHDLILATHGRVDLDHGQHHGAREMNDQASDHAI